MTLTSPVLLLWFAGIVAAAWLPPRRRQGAACAAVSAAFLCIYSPLSFCLLAALSIASYLLVRDGRPGAAGALLLTAACWTLLVGFRLARSAGGDSPGSDLLPLGLSFYALRTVHYAIDGWKGSLPPHTFGQYVSYQFFLPTLLAGPVNRFQEFHRGLARRRPDAALFSSGLERILYGYVKVVWLGNHLVSSKLAAWIGNHFPADSASAAYLGCARRGLNLYFQFSGYSDVAVGVALLLGLRVCENFDWPFLSRNINEFWQRWHISLSQWCRDYVYMPALAATRSPLPAILASMLVLGAWHELSWRYAAWGAYHGLGIAAWHLFRKARGDRPAPAGRAAAAAATACSWFLTMNFVILSFALTGEKDLASAAVVYARIFGLGR
jgi:alginate O-acetyltransferase complex protein AlgI